MATPRGQASAVVAAVGPALACRAVGLPAAAAAGGLPAVVGAVASAGGRDGGPVLEALFVAVTAVDTVLGGGAGSRWLGSTDPALGGASPAAVLSAGGEAAQGRVLAAARRHLAAGMRDGP